MRKLFALVGLLLAFAPPAFADASPPSLPSPPKDNLAPCPSAQLITQIKAAKRNVAAVQRLALELTTLSAPPSNDACIVTMFKSYYDFYGRTHHAYLDKLSALSIDDPKTAAIKRELATVNWIVAEGEAGFSVSDGREHWLEKNATSNLPAAWKKYLALTQQDVEEGFSEDAALQISWQQLRARLRRWEDFVVENPSFDSTELRRARAETHRLLTALLNGLDNTPAFDRETDLLDSKLRVELDAYLADDKAESRALVRKYYELLQANDWQRSDAAQSWLSKKKLVWPVER